MHLSLEPFWSATCAWRAHTCPRAASGCSSVLLVVHGEIGLGRELFSEKIAPEQNERANKLALRCGDCVVLICVQFAQTSTCDRTRAVAKRTPFGQRPVEQTCICFGSRVGVVYEVASVPANAFWQRQP